MKPIESTFRKTIGSYPLREIRLFQVNDHYFHYPTRKFWLIDGGVELVFGHTTYSLAWNPNFGGFTFANKGFEEIYTEENFKVLETIEFLNSPAKRVEQAQFKWNEIEVIQDYTMATKMEVFLEELFLNFGKNESLQIAGIDYDLEPESGPVNFVYDVGGELLVSFNHPYEIIRPDNPTDPWLENTNFS